MNKRIKNKLRKNSIIIMDIASKPKGQDLNEWYQIAIKVGLVLWDSMNGGLEPKIYPARNKTAFKIVKE